MLSAGRSIKLWDLHRKEVLRVSKIGPCGDSEIVGCVFGEVVFSKSEKVFRLIGEIFSIGDTRRSSVRFNS